MTPSKDETKNTEDFIKCLIIVKKWFKDEGLDEDQLVLGRMAARLKEALLLARQEDEKAVFSKTKNLGYDIINFISEKTNGLGIENYDDQEELAEELELMIEKALKESHHE